MAKATKTVLIGNENVRKVTFGKRYPVTVTFHRVGGEWWAHAGLMPVPCRTLRDCRIRVRQRLIQLARDNGIRAGE